jgi:hypothetical protein
VTFGLGNDTAPSSVEIVWPGGGKERIAKVPVKTFVKVVEGKGWVR